MPKYLMQAEVNCGVTYEVEATDEMQARQIMGAAIVHHVSEACDGIEIDQVEDSSEIDIGIRIGKDSTGTPYPVAVPNGLEFYERD